MIRNFIGGWLATACYYRDDILVFLSLLLMAFVCAYFYTHPIV